MEIFKVEDVADFFTSGIRQREKCDFSNQEYLLCKQ